MVHSTSTLLQQHQDLLHTSHMLLHYSLDLTSLDPLPIQLDLEVHSTQELQVTTWQPSHTVTCCIHPTTTHYCSHVHICLSCEIPSTNIPLRNLWTSQVQFTRHTQGNTARLHDNSATCIGQSTSDWHSCQICISYTAAICM